MPFWFSLAVHGTAAYSIAIESTLALTQAAAKEIRDRPELELLTEPELSVLCFKRTGWAAEDYNRWSADMLERGFAFVTPTVHKGEIVTRFAIVNPRTTLTDIKAILDTMR